MNQRKHPSRLKGGRNVTYIRLPSDLKRELREQMERDFNDQVQRKVEHDKNELAEDLRRRLTYRL